jgi:GNAT superfamily N-acetyltransferase
MSAAPIRIRRARPADAAELTRIAHAAKRHWRYPETLIRRWRADLTVTPESIAAAPVYCAAAGASAVLGFYALSGRRDRRELEHLWVDPAHMGAGVGRRLFQHLRRVLRRARVARLRIASDPNAEGFYRRMGAARIGSVASTPPGRRLPVLELRLQPERRR